MSLDHTYDDTDQNTGGGTGPVSNPQPTSGGWQVLASYQLVLNEGCLVDTAGTFKQSFTNGNSPWATRLMIDGSVLDDAWGQAPQDKITLMGNGWVGAGSHVVQLEWQAGTSVQAIRPKMKVTWAYK